MFTQTTPRIAKSSNLSLKYSHNIMYSAHYLYLAAWEQVGSLQRECCQILTLYLCLHITGFLFFRLITTKPFIRIYSTSILLHIQFNFFFFSYYLSSVQYTVYVSSHKVWVLCAGIAVTQCFFVQIFYWQNSPKDTVHEHKLYKIKKRIQQLV